MKVQDLIGAPHPLEKAGGDFAFGNSLDVATALGLQANGKTVVAANAMDAFALARFEGWAVLPTYLPVIVRTSEPHADVRKEG